MKEGKGGGRKNRCPDPGVKIIQQGVLHRSEDYPAGGPTVEQSWGRKKPLFQCEERG